MKDVWNRYRERIITLLLLAILFVGVVSIIALASGAVMKLFGFEYRSIGSIILFFIIATVISYPISMIASTLPKVLLSFGRLSKVSAVILYLILDIIATTFGLSVVDYFMTTVSATATSIIVVSILLALFGIADIDKKPKGVK